MRKTTLGKIAPNITSGSRGWASYYSDEGALFLRMTNLPKRGIGLLLHDNKYVTLPNGSSEGTRTRVQKNDILISITAELGKIGFVHCDLGEAYVNQHVALVRVEDSETAPQYLAYYLASGPERNRLNRLNDSGAKAGLSLQTINRFPLMLPPLPEQKAIAALLSTWDEAIEKTERLIQAKEKRFKWLLRELISDQCVEQNQGSEWKSYRLGKFIVERNEKSTAHDQHPVLTSSRKGLFYQSDYFSKQVTSSDNEGYKIVNKGDFTYRAMSDDGKFAFNRLDFCNHGIISPAYGVFYPKNINSDFLLFFMNSSAFFREVLKESQGGTRISLKLNAMKKILVSIPSIEKQNQIADTLTSAQREIDLLKQLADKYKTQKRGLMQKMLTGEWRVRGFATSEEV